MATAREGHDPDLVFCVNADYAGDYESDEQVAASTDGGLRAGPYLPPRTKRRVSSAQNANIKGGAQLPVSPTCNVSSPSIPDAGARVAGCPVEAVPSLAMQCIGRLSFCELIWANRNGKKRTCAGMHATEESACAPGPENSA